MKYLILCVVILAVSCKKEQQNKVPKKGDEIEVNCECDKMINHVNISTTFSNTGGFYEQQEISENSNLKSYNKSFSLNYDHFERSDIYVKHQVQGWNSLNPITESLECNLTYKLNGTVIYNESKKTSSDIGNVTLIFEVSY